MTSRGEGLKTFTGLKFGEGRVSTEEGKSLKGSGQRVLPGEAQGTQIKFSSSFGLGTSIEMSICPPPPAHELPMCPQQRTLAL